MLILFLKDKLCFLKFLLSGTISGGPSADISLACVSRMSYGPQKDHFGLIPSLGKSSDGEWVFEKYVPSEQMAVGHI